MTQTRRTLMWAVIALLAAMVSYLSFRAYLNPELLIHFANYFYC